MYIRWGGLKIAFCLMLKCFSGNGEDPRTPNFAGIWEDAVGFGEMKVRWFCSSQLTSFKKSLWCFWWLASVHKVSYMLGEPSTVGMPSMMHFGSRNFKQPKLLEFCWMRRLDIWSARVGRCMVCFWFKSSEDDWQQWWQMCRNKHI